MLRRYSRLYKLLYMTKQGTTTADNALVGTNDEAMVPGDTPVQNRALLKWSDRLEERVQKMLAFKEANVDVSKGLDWPPGANTSKDLETPNKIPLIQNKNADSNIFIRISRPYNKKWTTLVPFSIY